MKTTAVSIFLSVLLTLVMIVTTVYFVIVLLVYCLAFVVSIAILPLLGIGLAGKALGSRIHPSSLPEDTIDGPDQLD